MTLSWGLSFSNCKIKDWTRPQDLAWEPCVMGGCRVPWAPECSADSGGRETSLFLSRVFRVVIRISVGIQELKKKKGSAGSSNSSWAVQSHRPESRGASVPAAAPAARRGAWAPRCSPDAAPGGRRGGGQWPGFCGHPSAPRGATKKGRKSVCPSERKVRVLLWAQPLQGSPSRSLQLTGFPA